MIKIQDLSKTFKKQEVIKNLTINFNEGEKIALIGQNGAGKTTLIRCILGQYIYEGKMEVFDMDPRKDRGSILHDVGFVPQTPPPLKMTVEELLNFFTKLTNGTGNRGEPQETIFQTFGWNETKVAYLFCIGEKTKNIAP